MEIKICINSYGALNLEQVNNVKRDKKYVSHGVWDDDLVAMETG